MRELTDNPKRTYSVDDLRSLAQPLPAGVDLEEAIREASHDGMDRRFLRLQVQYWQEEQEAAGLDATIHDPSNPKHLSGETNLFGLIQKLKKWYSDEELTRLLPDVLVLFEE